MLLRHQHARVTREVSELSQNFLQEHFVHDVEPRKSNEAEKRAGKKVNWVLIQSVFNAFDFSVLMEEF